MPEGPEHHLAAKYINDAVGKLIFSGQVVKSDVANNPKKHPDVSWNGIDAYKIVACARGKEVKLTLTEVISQKGNKKGETKSLPQMLDIYFQFGMSGYFRFVPLHSLPKHAHLRFFTNDDKNCHALCFVDPRRFGKWRVGDDWSSERGPDPLFEYDAFRSNVLANLNKSAFNRPICEALLNQQYFNGIGNYLRSEILYRANVAPFECARNVIERIVSNNDVKSENPDILKLCSTVGGEVLTLSEGRKSDPDNIKEGYIALKMWFQCYGNPSMNKLSDHNGRTVWFLGQPGPLVPKGGKPTQSGGKSKQNLKSLSPGAEPLKGKAKLLLKKVKEERLSPMQKKHPKADPEPNRKNIQGRITRSMTKNRNSDCA